MLRSLRELLTLAMPSIAQMASYTLMQFIDAWMLSRLGGDAPTAASNSGILAFSLVALGMGAIVMVNTLVSQSFGRGDWVNCGRYLWQGNWLAIGFGVCLLPLSRLGGGVFASFGHPPQFAAMEATYWRIVLLSAPLKLASTSTGNFFLGINRPNAVLIAAALGVSVNALAAWCIVLGHFGFASQGVAGAAWAQNLGVTCELTTLALLALRPGIRRTFHTLDARFRPALWKTLVRIGAPSGLQWFSDVLAWSVFCNGVLGRLGTVAMQANTFMLRYMVVSFMPVYGLSTAVTALVGRYIGAGHPGLASARAHLGQRVATVYVLLCGTGFILARRPLMELFTRDAQVIRVGGEYLIAAAIYEIFDALYIIYSGALRGAGDTLAPTLVTATLCWTIMVGGGYAITSNRNAQHWAAPWIIACVYGGISGCYVLSRFLRGALADDSPWAGGMTGLIA